MAEMNGIELIREVKEINKLENVKIIALTSENSDDLKYEATKTGFNGWMTKPFNKNKLTSVISKIIEE
jgi:two-component system chemotaxis response regulator CheY